MKNAAPVPFLPFAFPSITDREKRAVLAALDSGWLTTGAQAKLFEERFAEKVGARHAIALNSATAGLHLALEAVGIRSGDEVIVPTWTFAASSEVVAYLGARPVLVDIDPATLNATADGVVAAVTTKTKAVIAVHFAGQPADVLGMVARLEPMGVPVVEDSAHAFPSRIAAASDRYAGTIGKLGAYSFYATKTITTGEGGMLVTDDQALADRVRLMSLHGISRTAWNCYAATGSWYYEIEDVGFQIQPDRHCRGDRFGSNWTGRRSCSKRGEPSPAPTQAVFARHVPRIYWSFRLTRKMGHMRGIYTWIRLNLDRLTIDRAEVMDRLKDLGIGASVHFIPLHMHPNHKALGFVDADFPIATRRIRSCASLSRSGRA